MNQTLKDAAWHCIPALLSMFVIAALAAACIDHVNGQHSAQDAPHAQMCVTKNQYASDSGPTLYVCTLPDNTRCVTNGHGIACDFPKRTE